MKVSMSYIIQKLLKSFKYIVTLILGAAMTIATQSIIEHRKTTIQEQDARAKLDSLVEWILSDVGHGSSFDDKEEWQTNLEHFAEVKRDWLGELYFPAKKILWKIRKHSFEHDSEESIHYCVDELVTDLSLLQLELLPVVHDEETEERAKSYMDRIVTNLMGVVIREPNVTYRDDPLVDEYYKMWKSGELKFGDEFVMAQYLEMKNRP